MPSKPFQRKLRALGYSLWSKFSVNKPKDVRTLVLWLEQQKIRELAVADRTELKKTDSPRWTDALNDYLDALGCPFRMSQRSKQAEWAALVDWLLSQAILREYEDRKAEYNKRKPIRRRELKEYSLTGTDSEEFRQALMDLCDFLKTPPHSRDDVLTCEALHTFIRVKFSPISVLQFEEFVRKEKEDRALGAAGRGYDERDDDSADEDSAGGGASRAGSAFADGDAAELFDDDTWVDDDAEGERSGGARARGKAGKRRRKRKGKASAAAKRGAAGEMNPDHWKSVANYRDVVRLYSPILGLTTGSDKVDSAAIILRMLYILDVRNMQNQLNEVLTFIQRFTANPVTNTRLGKVGW